MESKILVYERLDEMLEGQSIQKPSLLWDILYLSKDLEQSEQASIIQQLIQVSKASLHNDLVLMTHSARIQPDNRKFYIINYLIEESFDSSQLIFEWQLELIHSLAKSTGAMKESIQLITQKLSQQKDKQSIERGIKLLTLLLTQPKPNVPYNYLYFSGKGSGIQLNFDSQTLFPFVKGFAFCIWLRIEYSQNQFPQKLFTFHSVGNGGFEAYLIQDRLHYRNLLQVYQESDQNDPIICQIPYEQWTFIALQHERNCIKYIIDQSEPQTIKMDCLKIRQKAAKLTTGYLMKDFQGQVSCMWFFNEMITIQKMKNIYQFYNVGPQGHEALRSIFRILDKNLSPKLKLFYHPLRCEKDIAFDCINQIDGIFEGVSGAKQNSSNKLSFIGGIGSILPLLQLDIDSRDFIDWLQLLRICLVDRPENQQEAYNLKFFKALSQILANMKEDTFSVQVMLLLEDMQSTLMPQLKDQMTIDLLWSFQIWNKCSQQIIEQVIVQLINQYLKHSKTLSLKVGVSEILDILLEYFDTKDHLQRFTNKNSYLIGDVVKIIEIILFNGNDSTALGIKNMVACLYHKPNTEIQLHILNLIKKLIGSSPDNSISPYIFAKIFIDASGVELLLFLISSSTTEIRGLCLSCIDILLSDFKKLVSIGQPKDIFKFIAFVIFPRGPKRSSIGQDTSFTDRKSPILTNSQRGSFNESQEGIQDDLVKKISDLAAQCIESMYPERKSSNDTSIDLQDTSYIFSPQQSEEDAVYLAVLEVLLRRPLQGMGILDDTDYINSPLALTLFLEVITGGTNHIRHKALQDLLMLTKWNDQNSISLIQSQTWHTWLLNILYDTLAFDDIGLTIIDMGQRLHTIVLKQSMLFDENCCANIRKMLYWLESKRFEDCFRARNVVINLLQKLFESLEFNLVEYKPSLSITQWKNMIMTAFSIEELILYTKDVPENLPDFHDIIDPWLWFQGKWHDNTLFEAYFRLINAIWPDDLFDLDRNPSASLIELIQKSRISLLKTDIQLLTCEGLGELKGRGSFIKIVSLLALVAMKVASTPEELQIRLKYLLKIFMYLLFVGESCKKQLSNSSAKILQHTLYFIIAFSSKYFFTCIDNTRRSILKQYLFNMIKCVLMVQIFNLTNQQPRERNPINFIKQGLVHNYNITLDLVHLLLEGANHIIQINQLQQAQYVTDPKILQLLEDNQWQSGVQKNYKLIEDSFINFTKARQIWNLREKQVELQDKSNTVLDRTNEEAREKLHVHILKTAADKSDEEDQRRTSVNVYNQEKLRQKKQKLNNLIKRLKQPKGVWQELDQPILQPVKLQDLKQMRQVLKPKSKSSSYYLEFHKKVQLCDNPTDFLSKVAQSNNIKTMVNESLEDDEETVAEIEENYPSQSRLVVDSPLATILAKENCLIQLECGWITPLTVKFGLLQVIASKQKRKMRFVLDDRSHSKFSSHVALFKFQSSPDKPLMKEWSLDCLAQAIPKIYILRHTAIEFYFTGGKSVLFTFISMKDRSDLAQILRKICPKQIPKISYFKRPNPRRLVQEAGITEKWLNHEMSNFEYLMQLNIYASRSYNDLTQYPVYPWVLQEHESLQIDLSDPDIYRDLRKSIGSLGPPERAQFFMERYNSFDPNDEQPPFHYGSHYSNPGIVLHYLIRLFPFTEGAKELQGGKFDLADRLFMSIPDSFMSVVTDISDVREIIPEFYFLPEIFLNKDNNQFGTTQLGQVVNDVVLPNWAESPYEYVRIMYEALESDIVSQSLHNWIDLIFGYKQTGIEAAKSLNKFYYMTYEGSVDLDKITDMDLRTATEAQIVHFGKTPSQLFSKAHPQRYQRNRAIPGPLIVYNEANLKIYLPMSSSKEAKKVNPINYLDLSPNAILFAKLFKDDRIYSIKNNGKVTIYRWWPAPMGNSRAPFTCALEREKKFGKDYYSGAVETRDRSLKTYQAPIVILQSGRVYVQGGYWDGRISIQKVNEKEQPIHIFNHNATVTCIDIDEDEKIGLTGSKDGEIVLWNVDGESWQAKQNFVNHSDSVTSVKISFSLQIFASVSMDCFCNIYQLNNQNLLRSIQLQESSPLTSIAISAGVPAKVILFTPDQSMIYTFSINGTLLKSANERSLNMISPIVVTDPNQVDFLVNFIQIYGTESGDVVIRNCGTLDIVRRFVLRNSAPITTIFTTPDLRFLIIGGADGELTILSDPEAALSMLEKQWQLRTMLLSVS